MVVARSGGIIRAAERLHLAPQTLSGQISQFEERIGAQLFHRVGRRLELSETGKLALSYAEEIFQTGSELEELLSSGAIDRFFTFRVGVADVLPKFIVHRLLASVLKLPEAIRLICHEDRLDRLLADLALHSLDMVIADRPMPPGTEIKGYSHPLGESGIAFMASPALAEKIGSRFPANLHGAPMLLPGKDSALHLALPRWLERMNVPGLPQLRIHHSSSSSSGASKPSNAARNSSDVAASSRLVLMLVLIEVSSRMRLSAMWRTSARLCATWPVRARA